ncbi:MAG: hypothetical protein A3H42_03425 [Deltaproteobacteria bacterium RIFCSPLOWO2_02_FULL_46_8]|nr:MAG: hypothetical protein A3H42_03425 [Deltaproteobacteria bacterium RIFCSPLOWO2_02_FULL_46_8]
MEQARIPEINFRTFDQAFSDVGKIGFQPPHQKSLFQNIHIVVDGVIIYSQRVSQFAGVQNAPMHVSQHGHQPTHLQRIYADTVKRQVSFDKCPCVGLKPLCSLLSCSGQKGVRKSAFEPEGFFLLNLQNMKGSHIQKTNPAGQGF